MMARDFVATKYAHPPNRHRQRHPQSLSDAGGVERAEIKLRLLPVRWPAR
jgi:hypothetical protein